MRKREKFIGLLFFVSFVCILTEQSFALSRQDYSKIINRKIFADTPPPPQKPIRSILKPAPEPSLESIIGLKGIIYNPDGDSFAIVEVLGRKTEVLLNEGDIIENAYLKKINEFDVEFSYNGKDIKLVLPKPQTDKGAVVIKEAAKVVPVAAARTPEAPFAQVGGTSYTETIVPAPQQPKSINLNEIAEKLRSDPAMLSSVSVTPYIQDGRVEGFVVNRIPEGTISAQIGIQPGDVIKRVNGVLIDSLAKAYAVYNNIQNSQTKLVTVEIIRNGQPLILTYRLE